MAAASNDDAFVVVVQAAHLAHYRADVAARRDEEHLVISFDDRIALRQDRLVATEDRGHTRVDVGHVFADLAQLLPHQRSTVVGPHRDQLCLATREVDHLQRARVLDQTLDVVGHHLFGADQHVDRNRLVTEQAGAGEIHRLADSGNLCRCVEQGVGNLTGNHVGFVAVGYGDQHVRVIRTRLAQYRRE